MLFKKKEYEKKLRYNAEAVEFIKLLPKFNYEDFEKWIETLVLQIGSNNVVQYIEEKARWNTSVILKSAKSLRVDFSQQAKNIINLMPNFDHEDCKCWFNNAIQMSKGDILNFTEIMNKKGV